MRMTITLLVILLAIGCSAAAIPPSTSVAPPTTSHEKEVDRANLCFPAGIPNPVTVSSAATDGCRPVVTNSTDKLDAELNKRFQPSMAGATLGIEHGCSPLGDTITEVVFERGSGHGLSLELWRMTRSKDGNSYDLHGLAFAEARIAGDPRVTRPVVKVARAVVPAQDIDPHLAPIVAGLTVKPREIEPPPKDDMGLGMRGSSSSADFHLLVRLRDTACHQLQGQYTGYPSSSSALRYLSLVVVAEPLHDLVANIEFKETTVTNKDRAHFAERLADGQTRFDDDFTWWVMERVVGMACSFGSPPVIPMLLSRLAPQKRNRSSVDAEKDALEAIAGISGWDVRLDENGGERAVEDVARDYLSECGRAIE
jgi:hypothetical protein